MWKDKEKLSYIFFSHFWGILWRHWTVRKPVMHRDFHSKENSQMFPLPHVVVGTIWLTLHNQLNSTLRNTFLIFRVILIILQELKKKYLTNFYFISIYAENWYGYLVPIMLPLAQIGLTGSIYLTVAISIERYTTVVHPFFKVR